MIKSIETYYKGYLCRSRTEARWMVAFDKAGIEYEYEPEGFDLGKAGKYLPDFYLPEFNGYAEVKGRTFTLEEIEKARQLSIQSNKSVLFLEGQPARRGYWFIHPFDYALKDECIHVSKLPYSLKEYFAGMYSNIPVKWLSQYKAKNCGVWSSNEDFMLLIIDIFNPRKKFCFIKGDSQTVGRWNDRIFNEKEYIFSSPCGLEGVDESDSIAVRKSRSARFENFKK